MVEAIIIPEDIILAAAEDFDDANSTFSICIAAAKKFKEAGMTPIYLYYGEKGEKILHVVAEETFNKKLN